MAANNNANPADNVSPNLATACAMAYTATNSAANTTGSTLGTPQADQFRILSGLSIVMSFPQPSMSINSNTQNQAFSGTTAGAPVQNRGVVEGGCGASSGGNSRTPGINTDLIPPPSYYYTWKNPA
jgi:hypothetical protein